MIINFLFKIGLIAILGMTLSSCSTSSAKKSLVSISTASEGLVKDSSLNFPLYLTNKLESSEKIRKEFGEKTFVVHTGHILKPLASKKENEDILHSLVGLGINVVNLSLEDFVIANLQEISFESYPQKFLNSSVVNLNEDSIIAKSNVTPFIVNNGVALLGLSDNKLHESLEMEQFLVSDYVLAVLKARKAANKVGNLHSFIIIHAIGSDINDVLERLPPNFLNSLTD